MNAPDSEHNAIPATAPRYFAQLPDLSSATFPVSAQITDAVTVHHIAVVRRAKLRERVVLTDDERGLAYAATIQAIYRESIEVTLDSPLPVNPPSITPVTLIAGLIKEQRWDTLLKNVTELGVSRVQPVISERCVVRLSSSESPKKQTRWQALLRGAAEQSEGVFIPRMIPACPSVQALLEKFHPGGEYAQQGDNALLKLLLMERGSDRRPLKSILQSEGIPPHRPVFVAIGPEGGWADAEAHAFLEAGFIPASLGTRILRSETAATAALAAILYECDACP